MTPRRALLVDASGCNRGKILAGPPQDVLAYADFLMSVTGGAWDRKTEIDDLKDPDLGYLEAKIGEMSYGVQYFFFMFSGHGGSDGQCDIVELAGSFVNIQKLISACRAPQKTFIFDSCRSSTSIQIPSTGYLMKEAASRAEITISESQDWFAEALAQCPEGTAVCYACKNGQKAADTASGGLYSHRLIQHASYWSTQWNHKLTLNVHAATTAVSWDVYNEALKSGFEQEPHSRGEYFPFALATRKSALNG